MKVKRPLRGEPIHAHPSNQSIFGCRLPSPSLMMLLRKLVSDLFGIHEWNLLSECRLPQGSRRRTG